MQNRGFCGFPRLFGSFCGFSGGFCGLLAAFWAALAAYGEALASFQQSDLRTPCVICESKRMCHEQQLLNIRRTPITGCAKTVLTFNLGVVIFEIRRWLTPILCNFKPNKSWASCKNENSKLDQQIKIIVFTARSTLIRLEITQDWS